MSREVLALAADATNPLLLVAFAVCCWMWLKTKQEARAFLGRFGIAMGITYFFSHIKQWLRLWPEWGDFPSGHMTFLLTVATAFYVLERRSLWVTVPYCAAYGWLIVYLDYHTWFDNWTAALLAIPVTLACYRFRRWGLTTQGSSAE